VSTRTRTVEKYRPVLADGRWMVTGGVVLVVILLGILYARTALDLGRQ
jgi:hypothetical protein